MAEDIRGIGSREIYANQWLRLREDDIAYRDGSIGIYTVIEKDDFALVLPYADGGFWLVQQYRYALGRREWEFPQGGWPTGHSGTARELAEAELGEETGCGPGGSSTSAGSTPHPAMRRTRSTSTSPPS